MIAAEILTREPHPVTIREGVGHWCATCDEAYPCAAVLIGDQERRGGPGHRCQCRRCRPQAFPPVPDPGAPYVAVDNRIGLPAWATASEGLEAWRFRVEFNGSVDVVQGPDSWCVTEALAGEMGWMVVSNQHVRPPYHFCICGSWDDGPLCQRTEYGRVVLLGPGGLRVEG